MTNDDKMHETLKKRGKHSKHIKSIIKAEKNRNREDETEEKLVAKVKEVGERVGRVGLWVAGVWSGVGKLAQRRRYCM